MRILLPDDTELQLDDGATGADAAAAIGAGLARAALAVKVDGRLQDLSAPLHDGARLEVVTPSSEDALELLRHDAAHVLAAAVMDLYPGVKISIGPPIEQGFYYDFEFPDGVDDLRRRLRAHRGEDARAREGRRALRARGRDRGGGARALRARGPAVQGRADRGPREEERASRRSRSTRTVPSPTSAAARTAPARSASRRSSCSRSRAPTGAATRAARCSRASTGPPSSRRRSWPSTSSAWRRRRRATTASSAPSWGCSASRRSRPARPSGCRHGTRVFNALVALSREMGERHGYTEVKTPQIFDSALWETSGHWGKYRENMFVTSAEDRQMAIKPMNCPGHAHLFASERHSYRELPIRYSEPGLLHRNEPSGTLHGLLRVRHFAQDDAHIFCTEEQVQDEVTGCLDFAFATLGLFGFDVQLELSTRPEQRIGSDEMWDRAEDEAAPGARVEGARVRAERGRRRLLRAEDRLPREGLARPLVAARHGPARLLDARALRPHLHRRRRQRAPAGDDPPRRVRLLRALRRDPDRAPRRPLPPVARAGAGDRAADRRPPQRLRGRGRRQAARRGRARGGRTSAASRSGARSATRSCARSR